MMVSSNPEAVSWKEHSHLEFGAYLIKSLGTMLEMNINGRLFKFSISYTTEDSVVHLTVEE